MMRASTSLSRRLPVIAGALLVAATVALSACGSDNQQAETVTVEKQTTTVVQQSAPATTTEQDVAAAETAPAATTSSIQSAGGCSGGKIRVPDMVGKDHQLAQDTMQEAGLYNLSEEDATGQGRMLILDRNWTVVRQTPAGGSCVSDDATITLISKKDDE